jgi:hypothetical protein
MFDSIGILKQLDLGKEDIEKIFDFLMTDFILVDLSKVDQREV